MPSLFSRLGIGAAAVDTVLDKQRAAPGETLDAKVHVKGGKEAQEIGRIELFLATQYRTDEGMGVGLLSQQYANEAFTIEPGQERAFDVQVAIPYEAPLTLGHTRVWLRTELAVDWALDPNDDDQLQIVPDARVAALLEAVDRLGFRLYDAECKQAMHGFTMGFAQELEFRPAGGAYQGRINELELVIRPQATHVDVTLDVDARMKGIGGLLGAETSNYAHLQFSEPNVEAIQQQLAAQLDR